MLGFVTTDLAISKELLQKALSENVVDTFNMVSVDGDTSTNDMVTVLANGLAGNREIIGEGEAFNIFMKALNTVTIALCRKIAGDGEGATKLLESDGMDLCIASIISGCVLSYGELLNENQIPTMGMGLSPTFMQQGWEYMIRPALNTAFSIPTLTSTMEEMGFEIEASHHEAAQGQHEIDFKYTDALKAADNIMTFKLAVKTLAQKNGLHATFMPKPVFGINGSGMHTNMSLFRDGKNIFADTSDKRGLSKEAYAFIAGLLAHVRGMAAVTNPLVNSYKRLVPGYEAPCYLAWSASNRSALIRIPAARGKSTRVELRCPDPSCNPYLAVAVCLAAGLDGEPARKCGRFAAADPVP